MNEKEAAPPPQPHPPQQVAKPSPQQLGYVGNGMPPQAQYALQPAGMPPGVVHSVSSALSPLHPRQEATDYEPLAASPSSPSGLSPDNGRGQPAQRGDSAVRVHLRLALGGDIRRMRRGLDISLPTSSTLMEVLPEVLALIDAPSISLSWEFTSAAGRVFNQHVPIAELDLADGAVLILGPRRKLAAPVIKDSAEALVDAAGNHRTAVSTSTGSMLAGLAALGVLIAHPVIDIPLALKAAVLAVACTVVVAWPRGIVAAVPGALCSAVAATTAVGGSELFSRPAAEVAISVLIGSVTAVLYVVAVWVLLATRLRIGLAGGQPANSGQAAIHVASDGALESARARASAATVAIFAVGALAVVVAAATPAAWTRRTELGQPTTDWLVGACALLIIAGVVGMQVATSVAGMCAGLTVPRLPSAGADLKESDEQPVDPDGDARTAIDIHAGIHIGCAVGIIAGLGGIGAFGGWAALFVALSAFVALGLHAHRQAHPLCTWASWMASSVAVIAMALSAPGPDARAFALGMVLAAVAAVLLASAPLWSHTVARLEPTTVAWLERIESLALFAMLPIAVHLTGLFDVVRGL